MARFSFVEAGPLPVQRVDMNGLRPGEAVFEAFGGGADRPVLEQRSHARVRGVLRKPELCRQRAGMILVAHGEDVTLASEEPLHGVDQR